MTILRARSIVAFIFASLSSRVIYFLSLFFMASPAPMTSIHPSSVSDPASVDMASEPVRETTPENGTGSKQSSPLKTFASINTPPRRLTGGSAAATIPTSGVNVTPGGSAPVFLSAYPFNAATATPTQGSPISPSATQTPARRRNSETTTPLSSFVGRPPNSVSAQQRMLQSTFSVQSPVTSFSGNSFNSGSASAKRTLTGSPKVDRQDEVSTGIYTATYSGIPVFEMMVNGVAVMRRRHDSSLNATQILKVAGVDKSKRTKILEREILPGTHEKVQGGYGKYQGTWIPYERGVDLCKQYSVFDLLQPLLVFDYSNPGMDNTPTKEQAMAARRKRVSQYQPLHLAPPSTSSVLTFTSPLQVSGGFNTPLSHLASEALTNLGKPTSHLYPEELVISRPALNDQPESPAGPAPKKQKGQNTLIPDDNFEVNEDSIPTSSTPLEPLEVVDTPNFENSKLLITQVFVDTEATSLVNVFGGEERLKSVDLDVPIDDLQHTALHWASVLARIPLVKDLIRHGANPLRANHAGESGLIRAVLVTNNSDVSSFPQLLDLLYPAIPLVDKVGRSVLHHIALTAGIKGRSDASKYYLSCLLEWIVKRGAKSNRLGLGRFIQEVVNAQDKNGDTALNIAARVGNKHISQQLLNVGADVSIPNRAGLRPLDFGVRANESEVKKLDLGYAASNSTTLAARVSRQQQGPRVSEQRREERCEIAGIVNSLISEVENSFEQEFKMKNDEIQRMHQELRESSVLLEENKDRLEKLKGFSDAISRDKRRAENLDRAIEEEDTSFRAEEERQGRSNNNSSNGGSGGGGIDYDSEFNPDQPFILRSLQKVYDNGRATNATSAQIQVAITRELQHQHQQNGQYNDIPAKSILKARIKAYKANEQKLQSFAKELQGRSAELEQKFRRIVAQCASIKEGQVDSLLEGLVQAVESDPGEVDLSRVAGFLRKVDDGF